MFGFRWKVGMEDSLDRAAEGGQLDGKVSETICCPRTYSILTSRSGALAPAVGLKYAAANTDAGHTFFPNRTDAVLDAKRWALASPGNVNWVLLHNFASIAYDDMTHLAKSVVESFYGSKPKYSYFNGCSTGGRQGLAIAQRYPENYDGIVAAAPGINFDNLLVAFDWGQVVMRKENYFPPTCEFEAIRQAAIEACDEIDGVKVTRYRRRAFHTTDWRLCRRTA